MLRQCNVAVTTRNKGVMRKPYDFMRSFCAALHSAAPIHIPLNSPVKLRLTSSFSVWPRTATNWRPRMSRLTPAMALVLTKVER